MTRATLSLLIVTLALLLAACGGGTGDVLSPATLTATAAMRCPAGVCPPPATPAPLIFLPEAAATMTAAAASWQTAEPWMTPPPPLPTSTPLPADVPATMTAVYGDMAAWAALRGAAS